MIGFSIESLPDSYANVRRKQKFISAEVFRMCDILKKEVKVTYTGKVQHESGVDQFIRKSFSVFQNFNMPLCGNIYPR